MEARERETRDRLHALEGQNHNLNNVVQEKETVVIQNKKEAEDLTHQVLQLSEENDKLKKKIGTAEDDFMEQLRTKNRLIEDLEYSKSSSERRIKSLGKYWKERND